MTARLAVALDTTSVTTAQQWAEAVAEQADILKLGLEFYLANGRAGVRDVRRAAPGCGLFLDLKLHDIPATVAGAARAVADLAPDYLTEVRVVAPTWKASKRRAGQLFSTFTAHSFFQQSVVDPQLTAEQRLRGLLPLGPAQIGNRLQQRSQR